MVKIARDLLSIIGWSAASCGLALAVLLPADLHATSPTDATLAEITHPKFIANGIELSMQVDGDGAVQLIASNTTDRSAAAAVTFECRSFSLSDPTSRVPRPQTKWTFERSIALESGETQRIAFEKVIAPGEMIFVTTAEHKDAVMLLSQRSFKGPA